MHPKYAYLAYEGEKKLSQRAFEQLYEYVNTRLRKLGTALRGPVSFNFGNSGTAKTLTLDVAHLCKVTLTANATLTLSTAAVAGESSYLEVAQDATGGRVPTWTNATGTNGAVTAPAAGAVKKTLYLAVYNGTTWVLTVLASNY